MIIEKGSNIFELISTAHAKNIYEDIMYFILLLKTFMIKIKVIDVLIRYFMCRNIFQKGITFLFQTKY